MTNAELKIDKIDIQAEEYLAEIVHFQFYKAISSQSLPVESYVGLLKSLVCLYLTIENASENLDLMYREYVNRVDFNAIKLLQDELSFLTEQSDYEIAESAFAIIELVRKMRTFDPVRPLSLAAWSYSLEKFRMYTRTRSAPPENLFSSQNKHAVSYFFHTDQEASGRLNRIIRKIIEEYSETDGFQEVSHSVSILFEGLTKIILCLYPENTKLNYNYTDHINPEAGAHTITTDPRELLAVIFAGEQTEQEFPYLKLRYGQRGNRFANSDGAWSVALSHLPQESVLEQIHWLRGILVSRGMPTIILQRHLELLVDHLEKFAPEHKVRYAKLTAAANSLRKIRRSQVDDYDVRSLIHEFETTIEPELRQKMQGTGSLIISAVIDENSGKPKAVRSLESWLMDPSRFPDNWIVAVQDMISNARKTIQK